MLILFFCEMYLPQGHLTCPFYLSKKAYLSLWLSNETHEGKSEFFQLAQCFTDTNKSQKEVLVAAPFIVAYPMLESFVSYGRGGGGMSENQKEVSW